MNEQICFRKAFLSGVGLTYYHVFFLFLHETEAVKALNTNEC